MIGHIRNIMVSILMAETNSFQGYCYLFNVRKRKSEGKNKKLSIITPKKLLNKKLLIKEIEYLESFSEENLMKIPTKNREKEILIKK